MNENDVVSTLREAIRRAPAIPDGTLVRFEVRASERFYTYAALYVAATRYWYLTGDGSLLARAYRTEAFLDLLGEDRIMRIFVVTDGEHIR